MALEGKDLIGQARTGTGKTLAFALPIAERLAPSQERGRKPRALVLTPTRELALQVASELTAVAPHLKVVAVYGGTGYGKQKEALLRGADAVVATPGRALDYLRQGVLDLSRVEVAVLDEADEMLSMGFEEEVEALLSATPPSRQTLLFSATLPSWAKRLAERYMKNPVLINVIKDEPVTYEEEAVPAPVRGRLEVLSDLLYVASPIGPWSSPGPRRRRRRSPKAFCAWATWPRPSTGTSPRASGNGSWGPSAKGRCGSWWPRTWPPAAWTSPRWTWWCTTACPTGRRPTSTARAARAGRAGEGGSSSSTGPGSAGTWRPWSGRWGAASSG